MRVVKVSEVSGVVLDWLVAKCEGMKLHRNALLDGQIKEGWWVSGYYMDPNNWIPLSLLNFSADWAQGGPIIGRIKGLEFKHWLESKPESCCEVHIHNCEGDWIAFGPTPLIAAMRCYCCSKLGDVVDIPEELCQ